MNITGHDIVNYYKTLSIGDLGKEGRWDIQDYLIMADIGDGLRLDIAQELWEIHARAKDYGEYINGADYHIGEKLELKGFIEERTIGDKYYNDNYMSGLMYDSYGISLTKEEYVESYEVYKKVTGRKYFIMVYGENEYKGLDKYTLEGVGEIIGMSLGDSKYGGLFILLDDWLGYNHNRMRRRLGGNAMDDLQVGKREYFEVLERAYRKML